MAVTKAMALGTPVCTARHSGIPEIVAQGESGLLSDERDARGLSDNIAAPLAGRGDAVALAGARRPSVTRDLDETGQKAAPPERCRSLVACGRWRRSQPWWEVQK